MKEVVDGNARTFFEGMVKIHPTGKNTNAFLEAHGILLSKTASATNIPELEIENNNVKATHSASVHQIDEEQLFYLKTKGIPEEEAKKMILIGFLESAIKNIANEQTKKEMFQLIENKYEEEKQ